MSGHGDAGRMEARMRAADLERLVAEGAEAARGGACATYIPALAGADPGLAGLAVAFADGTEVAAGDADARFSMQSVSKALALAWVLEVRGEEELFSRVGVEPTGDAFNSIVRLETSRARKPFNPMINAGAIVTTSLMPGASAREKAGGFAGFVGRVTGVAPAMDEAVWSSERETAARNRSIAWMLRELGLVEGDVEEALDAYFMQCALLTSARELARAGAFLSRDGVRADGVRLVSTRVARTVRALMALCGLYDGSGAFAVAAGVPAKSGVGGGIMAAARDGVGIGAFGPALDEQGNSLAGVSMISGLVERFGLRSL